ncbi:alpha/beta hydrolase [Burkholderia sp. FERM BP-3421]|uniref:alpha/beta fold hydrolase n=1 Tax=Burkholderia sp. FERM BP-3421 TaxID=1494466 RepID=UPI002361C4DF|nr:alpha/beta fold hydrolase [Burkholderia sp. FERM BP-3421]WDD91535.1 alpha/beta hydrolase [Burkholderia sp. FERM BP-3421]
MNGPTLFHRLDGAGPEAVVMLPGLQADHRIWRAVQASLSPAWRTVAADNRGFGRSGFDGAPLSIETMADDVLRLMDSLSIERFCVAGHSMGGAIAQWLAHRHPGRVRALALCNTFRAMRSDTLTAIQARLRSPCDARDWADIQHRLSAHLLASGPLRGAAGAAIVERRARSMEAGHVLGLRRQLDALLAFDSRAWVGGLRVPTLIVDSAADRRFLVAEADALAGEIPAAQRVTLPGGHASTIEQWRALAHLLETFFGIHAPGRPPRPAHPTPICSTRAGRTPFVPAHP